MTQVWDIFLGLKSQSTWEYFLREWEGIEGYQYLNTALHVTTISGSGEEHGIWMWVKKTQIAIILNSHQELKYMCECRSIKNETKK